ncbi:MAG: hypothetical protein JRI66_12740 [Deltaproteobacteria bacterium]|nr:hypothetical protein [Deltaproteobacteria bacterium]
MTKATQDRVKPVPPPPGPKSETKKEFLKAALMRCQTQYGDWKKEVHDYFQAKSQEVKEEKVRFQWCLSFTGEVPADKNLLFQKAQELARALRQSEEVANKFKRLVARVSVCQDKPDLLAAVARFFPNLKAGTQEALNACQEQWQSWDLPSLKKLFLLTKIFLEAQA